MKTPLNRWIPFLLWILLATTASAFYDPHLGRWINRDPIGEDGGENVYRMVSNDPINKIDPNGESEITIAIDRNTLPTQRRTGIRLATIGDFTMSVKVDRKCEQKKFDPVSGVTMEPPPVLYNMYLQYDEAMRKHGGTGEKLYPAPPGTYDAEFSESGPTAATDGGNFKLKTPGTGWSGVYIHAGSTPLSSEGCILVGTGWKMGNMAPGGRRPGSDVPMAGINEFPFLLGSHETMGKMVELYKKVKEFDAKCCSKTTIKVTITGGR